MIFELEMHKNGFAVVAFCQGQLGNWMAAQAQGPGPLVDSHFAVEKVEYLKSPWPTP